MTVAGGSIHFKLRSGTSWKDPFPMYRMLRDHDPVPQVQPEEGHNGFWFLSRFAATQKPSHLLGDSPLNRAPALTSARRPRSSFSTLPTTPSFAVSSVPGSRRDRYMSSKKTYEPSSSNESNASASREKAMWWQSCSNRSPVSSSLTTSGCQWQTARYSTSGPIK